MPLGQIETFDDIITAWQQARRESDRRAVWRILSRGGWFRACQDAVQKDDQTSLASWLDPGDPAKQHIIEFNGQQAALTVRVHLLCGLTASQNRIRERDKPIIEVPQDIPYEVPYGFCCDLTQELLGVPPRATEREVSLNTLLVDTARNEGMLTTLTLGLVPDGNGDLYPTPAFAFIRDATFCQAENDAREWLKHTSLTPKERDIRWQLQRHDGKPFVQLTGPSMGAAFGLGMAKLLARE